VPDADQRSVSATDQLGAETFTPRKADTLLAPASPSEAFLASAIGKAR
jgi:hypothetical protein